MGRFVFVKSKSFEFIFDTGQITLYTYYRAGKGFLRSVRLGRGDFWLLLTVDEVARLDNSVGFIKKFRDSQSALLCQRSCNSYGAYLAIEEFSGGGLSFSSLKVSRSGDGVALLRCPFITVNHVIEIVWLWFKVMNVALVRCPWRVVILPRARSSHGLHLFAFRRPKFLQA